MHSEKDVILAVKCGPLGMLAKKVGDDIQKATIWLEKKNQCFTFINAKFKALFCKSKVLTFTF